ncbi:hypothetical protein T484DRAFT_1919376, partial [Baffinella frigidus]
MSQRRRGNPPLLASGGGGRTSLASFIRTAREQLRHDDLKPSRNRHTPHPITPTLHKTAAGSAHAGSVSPHRREVQQAAEEQLRPLPHEVAEGVLGALSADTSPLKDALSKDTRGSKPLAMDEDRRVSEVRQRAGLAILPALQRVLPHSDYAQFLAGRTLSRRARAALQRREYTTLLTHARWLLPPPPPPP